MRCARREPFRRRWACRPWIAATLVLFALAALPIWSAERSRIEEAERQFANDMASGSASPSHVAELLNRMAKRDLLAAAVRYFRDRLQTREGDSLADYGLGEALRLMATPADDLRTMQEAEEHLDASLRAFPTDRIVRLSAARAQYALRDGEAALATLRPLLVPPDEQEDGTTVDIEALELAADVYVQQRELALAAGRLRDILDADPKNVPVRMRLAELLRIAGRYDEAAQELGVALRHRNRSPEIYYALGQLYAYQDDPNRAIDMYRRARRYDPKNVAARYTLADIFLKRDNGRYAILAVRSALAIDGRYDWALDPLREATTLRAAEILSEALDRVPDNAPLEQFVARLYLKLGDRDKAREHLEAAKALDPGNAAVRARLAALVADDNPTRAAEELRQAAALSGSSSDADVLAAVADAQQREGNLAAYADTMERLLAVAPGDAQKEADLGDALLDLAKKAKHDGDTDTWKTRMREAANAYRRATELDPNNAKWKLRLGGIYADLGMLKAVRVFQEAAELDPENAQIYYRWGVFLLNFTMGTSGTVHLYDPQDGIEYLQRAVQLDPKLRGAYYALGIAYKRQGAREEAVQALERADALGFLASEGMVYLATYYADTGQDMRALEMFARAAEALPDDVEVLKDFGFLALKHGNRGIRERAEAALKRALELQPDDPETLMNYGFALHDSGRSAEAVPFLEHAAKLDPDSPLIRYDLALALDAAGKRDRAIATWRQLLSMDPDGAYAAAARERLQYLTR